MGASAAVNAARRRREIEHMKKQRLARAQAYFDKFDTDFSGDLSDQELRPLLMTMRPDLGSPDDATLEFLRTKCQLVAQNDGQITRDNVVQVLDKYVDYATKQKLLNNIFEKMDTNKSGCLERDQVKDFLVAITPGVWVDKADVDFVLEACDLDHSDSLSRDEVLPAIAFWKALRRQREAEFKREQNQNKKGVEGCCVVM